MPSSSSVYLPPRRVVRVVLVLFRGLPPAVLATLGVGLPRSLAATRRVRRTGVALGASLTSESASEAARVFLRVAGVAAALPRVRLTGAAGSSSRSAFAALRVLLAGF